jgi:hypothetical protein
MPRSTALDSSRTLTFMAKTGVEMGQPDVVRAGGVE